MPLDKPSEQEEEYFARLGFERRRRRVAPTREVHDVIHGSDGKSFLPQTKG